MKKQQTILAIVIILLAVGIDQWMKIYIHSHFALGEVHKITSWFELCYIENNGMAFGIQWFSKLLLSLFRIGAVGVLVWYMNKLIHKGESRTGYVCSIALLTAGALGNIIDCVFYGRLFGYADWFYGRVVDMLYFPLIRNAAGECIFFRPVFNFADSCVTVSVALLLIFFRKDLDNSLSHKPAQ